MAKSQGQSSQRQIQIIFHEQSNREAGTELLARDNKNPDGMNHDAISPSGVDGSSSVFLQIPDQPRRI